MYARHQNMPETAYIWLKWRDKQRSCLLHMGYEPKSTSDLTRGWTAMADLRRRRSMQREMSADEQLDAMIAEAKSKAKPPGRAKTLTRP